MKPLPLLIAAVVLALGTSLATSWFMAPAGADVQHLSSVSAQVDRLQGTVDGVREQQQELARTLAAVQNALSARAGSTAIPLADIERTVVQVLEQRGLLAGAGDLAALVSGDAGADESLDADGEALTLESALARMGDESLSHMDREMLWEEIKEAGLLDAVVAKFEQLAEGDPNNAELRVALGAAYLQKTQEAGAGAMAGVWATKADKAFDQALAIDNTNWDARFTKAVALSFWPPILGKQNEAISHFETLIKQQEAAVPKAHHAETYKLLGNMYNQMGQPDKALATWQAGYQLFPDATELKTQIDSAQ